MRVLSAVMVNVPYLDRGFGCIGMNIDWDTLAAHLRFMHFTVYKSYLKRKKS